MNFVSEEFGITKNVPLESKIKTNLLNSKEINTNISTPGKNEEEKNPIQKEEDKKNEEKKE